MLQFLYLENRRKELNYELNRPSEGKIKDRLLYLCRIASGCGMELHAEELYQAVVEIYLYFLDYKPEEETES